MTQNDSPALFALHGIRTHARWTYALAEVARDGWQPRNDRWNFGYFPLYRFLVPWHRSAKVRWFREVYGQETGDRDVNVDLDAERYPSIVAHSFGTYILGNALLKYDTLKFDKVLVCGSILPVDFAWGKLLDRGQVRAVRNEYGVKDVWCGVVQRFVRGTGPSGRTGFQCDHERFEQQEFPLFEHSDYFDKGHMREHWLPFLNRNPRKTIPAVAPQSAICVKSLLQKYCEHHFTEWERWRHPQPGQEKDEHRLDCYVEPHFGIQEGGRRQNLCESSQAGTGGDQEEIRGSSFRRVCGEDRPAIAEFVKQGLLDKDTWLCLVEDAGAGKSVFSLRLRAFFSSPETAKQLGGDDRWLAVRIEKWPTADDNVTPLGLVQAMAHEVAADTNTDVETAHAVVDDALRARRAVLILDALDQQEDRVLQVLNGLKGNRRLCMQLRLVVTSRLHAVNEQGQQLFSKSLRWQYGRVELFDKQQQDQYLRDLDQNALGQLIPDRGPVAELLQFPVVLQMIRELLENRTMDQPLVAFRHRGDLFWRVSTTLLERAFKKSNRTIGDDDEEILTEVLGTMAFQMLLNPESRRTYVVPQGEISKFKEASFLRFLGSDGRLHGQREAAWNRADAILRDTQLTDRCILEGNDLRHLGFRSRKMMEFFGGVYLAKFATEDAIAESRTWIGAADWYWPWRFAIELREVPRSVKGGKGYDEEILRRSLSLLFERPAANGGLSRPNELIYRAWPLLTGEGGVTALPGGPAVIARFLEEFRELVAGSDAVALELAHGFIRCPPEELEIDREPVSPFLLQKTPVTRRQYRLYDPEHERVHSADSFGHRDVFARYAPDLDCPMLRVSWYDAWVFSRWLGGRLPTEAEWEYACRAGTETEYSFGDDPDELGDYGWFRDNSGGRTQPVGLKKPNAWGLYDMHGNVWEWCFDWYSEDYYANFPLKDPTGPESGSDRVFRGGCWRATAGYCRSASRRRGTPGDRLYYLGFRVAFSSVE